MKNMGIHRKVSNVLLIFGNIEKKEVKEITV